MIERTLRQNFSILGNASETTLRFISLAFLLLVWSVAALLVAGPSLPAPWTVAVSMWQHIVAGDLPYHLSVTLVRVFFAFVLAMSIGTAIGIIMGRSRRTDILFDGWVVLGLNIPALVVIILCYIWMGLTDVAAVIAVAVNKIPLVIVMVREGARALDRDLSQVSQIYRFSPFKTLKHVTLPQLYPYIMAAARNGLALIWKIVLVVELLGRSDGVGFQLSIYFQYFDISAILAYTLAFIGIIFLIEAAVLRPLEVRANRWRL